MIYCLMVERVLMCLVNARLAQSGERKSYKLDVVGSTPTLRTICPNDEIGKHAGLKILW